VDDKGWRNVSVILGVVCALLIGAAGALILVIGPGGSSQPTVSATPSSSATPEDTSSLEPSESASPEASPSGTAGPTPTPQPTQSAPTAAITFNDMQLDADSDPGKYVRTFSFMSDGWGDVKMSVTKASGGTTKICAKVDASAFSCKTGSLPGFPKAKADTAHSVWTVTLIGVGAATPTVDVAFSWPTNNAQINLLHGRFQGMSPGVPLALNGFTTTFVPRSDGNVKVDASWTVIVTDVRLDLADVTNVPFVVDEKTYSGVQFMSYTHSVDSGKTYKVLLRNTSADNYKPDLTVQISFS
jgi:hypothetical protein